MVTHPEFNIGVDGKPRVSPRDMLEELLAKAPKILPSDAQLLLRERYDTVFGIYNHDTDDKSRPLAVVEMHWQENTLIGSSLYERMTQYDDAGIYDCFKLSLKEWLDQESHIVSFQLRYARIKKEAETKRMAEGTTALSALERQITGGKR